MEKALVINFSMDDSLPLIWRTIEVPASFMLEDLHLAIQNTLGWYNYHLYRFAKKELFSVNDVQFVSAYDEAEGEISQPLEDVALASLLSEQGDTLRYAYDYGDGWEFTLRVEEVKEADTSQPIVTCVDGRRAAPPEDCGGRKDAESLKEVLDDPSYFSVAEANSQINAWLATPQGFAPLYLLEARERHEANLLIRYPIFKGIYDQCFYHEGARQELISRLEMLQKLATSEKIEAERLSLDEVNESFGAVLNLLQLVHPKLKLTKAGYMPPAISEKMKGQLGKLYPFEEKVRNESDIPWLYEFREELVKLGFLRKAKGELLVTQSGQKGLDDAQKLPDLIAAKYLKNASHVKGLKRSFENEALRLLLLYAATADNKLDVVTVAEIMSATNWRIEGDTLTHYDLRYSVGLVDFLGVIAPIAERRADGYAISRAAIWLARAALSKVEPAASKYARCAWRQECR